VAGVRWSEQVDNVLGGDLTAALAYVTPAGGAVVTAVAPLGLRDRERGEVTFTTSLGLGKKLERIRRDPKVALLYHAREHGYHRGDELVLVQGTARVVEQPDADYLQNVLGPAAASYLGEPKTGRFWDRWLQEYYNDRVPVHVDVERVASWPSLTGAGELHVEGAPWPVDAAPPQAPPRNGTGPRVDADKAADKARALAHVLFGYRGADGFPVVVPVRVGDTGPRGFGLTSALPLPRGGRRAGLLAHEYHAQLIGLKVRQHTGWFEDGIYAPHTQQGYNAPANKTLLMLGNGFVAKQGLRKARKAAATTS